MRLIAPTILLVHWVGLLTYFTVIKYHPECSKVYGWSVFYFSINNLTIINYCLMFMYCPKCKISNQFILIDVIFTTILAFLVVLNGDGMVKYVYGFQLSVLGMIITTILIVINGIKYGIFKDEN